MRGKADRLMGALMALLLTAAVSMADERVPQRVVSINLCTDQLAMLLSDGAQLKSVSYLARDPRVSAMAEQAMAYAINHRLAEEIFLMKPDLVLAGSFMTRETVDMLRGLGFRVETFQPAGSFEDIRAQLRRMGDLLRQQAKAEALIKTMDRALMQLPKLGDRKVIAFYDANNYTSGRGTLIDDVVKKSGLTNLADQAGLVGSGRLPLEMLVMAKPDFLVMSERYAGPALAFQNYDHPALRALISHTDWISVPGSLTACGGPFTVKAVQILADAAHE